MRGIHVSAVLQIGLRLLVAQLLAILSVKLGKAVLVEVVYLVHVIIHLYRQIIGALQELRELLVADLFAAEIHHIGLALLLDGFQIILGEGDVVLRGELLYAVDLADVLLTNLLLV